MARAMRSLLPRGRSHQRGGMEEARRRSDRAGMAGAGSQLCRQSNQRRESVNPQPHSSFTVSAGTCSRAMATVIRKTGMSTSTQVLYQAEMRFRLQPALGLTHNQLREFYVIELLYDVGSLIICTSCGSHYKLAFSRAVAYWQHIVSPLSSFVQLITLK